MEKQALRPSLRPSLDVLGKGGPAFGGLKQIQRLDFCYVLAARLPGHRRETHMHCLVPEDCNL